MTENDKTLAAKYRMDVRTLRRLIRPIRETLGRREGRMYTPRQVKIIVDHLGPPGD